MKDQDQNQEYNKYLTLYTALTPANISPSLFEPHSKIINQSEYAEYLDKFYKTLDENNIIIKNNILLYNKLKKDNHTCIQIMQNKIQRYYEIESILPWKKIKKDLKILNFPQYPASIQWCNKKKCIEPKAREPF
jgi:hypothetical protein